MILETFDSVLKIHCCRYQKNIHPWIQNRLYTPYWRFYWNPVIGGCLKLKNDIIRMTPEFVYIIPGYLEFSTFAERPFEQFFIHFNPSDRTRPPKQIFQLPAKDLLTSQIRAIIDLPDSENNQQIKLLGGMAFLSSALLQLPQDIFRLPDQADPRIEELCKWLANNRSRMLNNSEIAARVGLERNSFIRLFKTEMNESPQSYFRRKRIELACELLHFSNQSIEEVAAATGFADRYHFTRVFTKVLRTTPAVFRRNSFPR